MIITGGYNVYPREVEDALLAHAAVLECAVVGAPHDKWVEAVTAFVVLQSGGSASEDELIEFTRARLASYKVPKSVRFVEQIPKSANFAGEQLNIRRAFHLTPTATAVKPPQPSTLFMLPETAMF